VFASHLPGNAGDRFQNITPTTVEHGGESGDS
jgi:hypothetical protein